MVPEKTGTYQDVQPAGRRPRLQRDLHVSAREHRHLAGAHADGLQLAWTENKLRSETGCFGMVRASARTPVSNTFKFRNT
jgi:hypothetical protein